ncbi:hypothetical protein BS50DRAFT_593881 [Corynespora cassiicola Philippines]|uniref:Uncharacterized protein n=1 Tax=Corynespora cassiicola Philippines TaxID=1448308 RepID=A0A2T2N4T7_CORCC|nr:hypothetical protein BS50DRAFT_593881 [Corynespora cassiicola Philippines]
MSPESAKITSLISDMSSTSLQAGTDDQAIYHRVPNELLIAIFEHALKTDKLIDDATFWMLCHRRYTLGKFLFISRWSVPMVLDAFYKVNKFFVRYCYVRTIHDSIGRLNDYDCSRIFFLAKSRPSFRCFEELEFLQLPQIYLRSKLTYLEVDIRLLDAYFEPYHGSGPARMKSVDGDKWNWAPIQNPSQLWNFTRGWKTLRDLTSEEKGFPNLSYLKLNLALSFQFCDVSSIWRNFQWLVRDLGIRVSAGNIEVSYIKADVSHHKTSNNAWSMVHESIQWSETDSNPYDTEGPRIVDPPRLMWYKTGD